MAIRAQMHDGTVLEFPDNTDPAVVDRAARNYITESASKQVDEAKPAGFSAKETALALGQGVLGAGKSLADVFGAENVASQGIGSLSKSLGAQYSPERQAEMARRQALQEKASKSGSLVEEISTFLGGVAEAPVQSLAQGIGSIVPFIGTGILGKVAELGAPVVRALNAAIGAGMGAGSVKGSLYDGVKRELEKSGMKSEEAAAKASKAQEYLGENFLDIAAGAALGGVESIFGAEKAFIPNAAQKLSSSLIPRVSKAALAEAPLEGVQGGQEQLATNRALQKLGFDVGTFEGVAGAAARDAAIGAITGAAVGIKGPKGEQVLKDAGITEEEKTALLDAANKIAPPAETTTTATTVPPEAMDLETLLAPNAPKKLEDETVDFETPAPVKPSGKNIEQLEKSIADRQAKLDAGTHKNPKAAVNTQAKEIAELEALKAAQTPAGAEVVTETTPAPTATKESIYAVPKKEAGDYLAAIESKTVKPNPSTLKKHLKALGIDVPTGAGFSERAIQAIKATLGGQDVIQQTNAPASGVSTELLGGPDTTGAAAGAADVGLGRPGVASNQGIESTPQDGAGAQQLTLVEWLQQKGLYGNVNTTEEMNALTAQWRSETGQTKEEVIDEQALADQEAKAAAAAAAADQERAAFEKDQAEKDAAEAAAKAAEQEIAGKNIPQTKTNIAIREEYELSREALAGIEVSIPPWDKLTSDERDKYLGLLKTGASAKDFDDAGKALAAYREQKKGLGLKPAEQRIVNGYEESRAAYQRSLGIDMPAWGELSQEAQTAYLDNVKKNTVAEQDAGFEAVAAQLEQEDKGIRNVSREGIKNLRLKGTEEVSKATAVQRIAKEAAAEASAQGKGEPISNETRAKLEAGDINGVLSDLISSAEGFKTLRPERGDKTYRQAYTKLAKDRKRASSLTFRLLANALNRLRFTSTVVTDPNNEVIQRLEQENKLAEYDPKTDTFYFTPGGFDESTVLHEIVHAGTVKIIKQFLTDPSKLTDDQRQAAEHLQKIYDHSKKRLGGKFKNAYENLYEFVSYAMTDNKFQIALSEMQVRPLAKYTAKAMNAWKQITQALSKMFGLYDAKAETNELTAEMYKEVAREYGSMDPNELYEDIKDLATIEDFALSMSMADTATEKEYAESGKETEVTIKKEKVYAKQARKFLTTYPGYEGNLLLEMSEVFSRILATPEAGIDVAPLAKKEDESAVEQKMREDAEIIPPKDSAYAISAEQQPKNIKYFQDLLFTKPGWRRIVTKIQNERYAIKHWQDENDLRERSIYEGKKINTINDQLTLATGRAKNKFNEKIEALYEALDQAVYNLSKATDLAMDKTLDMAHRVLEALHEPERRLVKYLMVVPLSNTANIQFGNTKISAADLRERIFKALDSKTLTDAQAKQLRKTLDSIVFTTDANGNQVPNTQYVDPLGSSPKQTTKKDANGNTVTAGVSTDITNDIYNVTGLTADSVKARMANYDKLTASNPEIKKQMDAVIKNIQKLHDVTTELNKEANYWSQPVSNRVAFYGFDNYIPLKGVTKHTAEDEFLDFDGAKMGKELQEVAHSFDGRISVSDNPVLQTMSDAVRAAMRAGRKDLTLAIKNSLKADKEYNPDGQGLLAGKVKMHVTFEQRRDENFIKALPRENTVFHYNPDGSIDVLEINDKSLREAIRRTYKNTNPLVDIANNITSRLGQLHTRYNYNFAPLNFVRDALTNAWTIGAEMGPKQSAKFISDIATKVIARGALRKAWKVASLYESKDIKKIEELAAKDPTIKEMHEFIQQGGMVEYLQGISLKSNFQRLHKDLGRSGVMRKWEQFNKFVDIWTDMFELTSRSAAYAIAKKNFMEKGMTKEAAITKAAAYAKNLANFEQVGEYGRGLGAVFMFFRPSATGAVRAVEAALPAFQNVDKIMKSLPADFTEADKAAYKKNFLEKQKAARYMLTAMMSMGAFAYTMAIMMADDDDLGRNKAMNDDMSQWTRFARFHTPFSDTPIQLPWGFGLGAFAAAGAQLAGVMSGQQSIGKALGNVATQISLDSFVPIPFSRMPIQDNPALWMLDSLTPSMLRPALEWTVNKNGLGQDIYNDSNRRMGDAYVGGDNIPETYKVLTKQIFDTFEIDISPNTLYFLANSYADGPMRVVDAAVNSMYLAAGAKEFKAKTDVPLIGSFIGAEPNVDGREFASIEKDIKAMEQKMNMLKKADLEKYDDYLDRNPLHEEIVEFYNKEVGKHLNKLRKEANEVRFDQNLNPKERAALLKENKEEQNIIKYDMVQQFKEYGLKP